MTISVRLESQVESAGPYRGLPLQVSERCRSDARPQLSIAQLAFKIYAAFRAHSHICNVLTHISCAKWTEVERALNTILDPATTCDGLSPLEQNIIDLLCAERGITGKILKPYFHATLYGLIEPERADRLIRHVERLFLEIERKAEHPPAPAPGESSKETAHG